MTAKAYTSTLLQCVAESQLASHLSRQERCRFFSERTIEPPFNTRRVLVPRKIKNDAGSPAQNRLDNKRVEKPKKENHLLHGDPAKVYVQLTRLLNGMPLLADTLNDLVVDYLIKRTFHIEPQLVVKFDHKVLHCFVGDDILLLIGLNARQERVVHTYNLLAAETWMLSELKKDEKLLAFGAYPGVYIYVEQKGIILKSIDDDRVLLMIPEPVTDYSWQVRMAPSAPKGGLVYISFLRKIVLININHMTCVVNEIENKYGKALDTSPNEAETLLVCSTDYDGFMIFNVQCDTNGEIKLVECPVMSSSTGFSSVRFLSDNTLAAKQLDGPHIFIVPVGMERPLGNWRVKSFPPKGFMVFPITQPRIFLLRSSWKKRNGAMNFRRARRSLKAPRCWSSTLLEVYVFVHQIKR